MDKLSMLERLPEELRHQCLSYCSSSTILNLCLASKALHNLCIHSLFYNIDLTTHNENGLRTHRTYNNVTVSPCYANFAPTNAEQEVTRRQSELMRLLREHPDMGGQTRILRWSLVVTDAMDPRTSKSGFRDRFNYGTGELWDTFACFNKITELDLFFMSNLTVFQQPPATLFSTATTIRLGGVASYTVICTIFNSVDLAKVKHLQFNNLQTYAEDAMRVETLHGENMRFPRSERAGAAQGFLTVMTGHCSTLRSFHFLTTAELWDGSHHDFHNRWPTQVADENRRYAELGAFIDSVRPTLRELVFEHGPDIDYFSTHFGQRYHRIFAGQNHDGPLPMDVFFDTHLLPTLSSGPWPKLTSMSVKGIGHWKPIDAWREEATNDEVKWLHEKTAGFRQRALMLWDAVPDGCEITVKDEASQPFYRFQADKTVNGRGTDAL